MPVSGLFWKDDFECALMIVWTVFSNVRCLCFQLQKDHRVSTDINSPSILLTLKQVYFPQYCLQYYTVQLFLITHFCVFTLLLENNIEAVIKKTKVNINTIFSSNSTLATDR